MARVIDVTEAREQLGTILENDNSQSNKLSPSQQSLLEEMEGLPVISIDNDPTKILRTMRKEKRVKADGYIHMNH